MRQMLKATGAIAGATLISRLLGLVREMVYARFMGNGWVASAFLLAFQIPNLFRRLLGEGALTAAFIPQFKAAEKNEGEAAMWRSANAVLSGLVVAASVVVALAIGVVSGCLMAGDFDTKTRLMLRLLRLMFPYLVMVCVAAVCMGMLNARGKFFVPALGSTVLNVIMIASVLLLAPRMGTELPEQIYGLAIGVLAAGVAQAAFQLPALMADGWRFRWVNPWRDPMVGEVVRRMIPTTMGVAAFQINVMATQGFAFFLGESIVASFQYAVRLMELPQGLFGASMAAYLLPTLSGYAAEKRYGEYRSALVEGLASLVLVNVLAGALLVGLAEPIVRLLFEGGLFHAGATRSVASALAFLAPGLVGFSGTSILARAFYAVGDTKVPMQISLFCLALNVVLSMFFALAMREAGLALANTLTSTLNLLLLAYALRKKMPKLDFGPLLREAGWVVATAVVAGAVAWGLSAGWSAWQGERGFGIRLVAVFGPATLGAVAYFGVLWGIRVPSCRAVLGTAFARLRKNKGERGEGRV
ncbi:MAG: murein biosynthesis integral membrane protein MurJ [Verrucomicrobiales bacterium]|nr:murein biosynthesis integral membrane protein MurJ [Verrucomicrobiales bacterium]